MTVVLRVTPCYELPNRVAARGQSPVQGPMSEDEEIDQHIIERFDVQQKLGKGVSHHDTGFR